MKICLLFGVSLLCLAGIAAAQPSADMRTGAVVGKVFDSGLETPIEYANVVLYALPESTQVDGTVTDATGAFRLDGVKPGRYYVELSFIGYRDRSMKEIEVAAGGLTDLGRIGLELKPIAVTGVEATAEKPAVSYEVDKRVVDVSKLPNASAGTAVDALRDVPSVKVDIEDNVTLRGSSNFKVLIDGKPTLLDANDALKQTPAQTIDKIEIITNPSAKYEPDGAAGIINLVLKKQKGSGFSALANANGDYKGRFGGDALLSFRRGIVNVFGGGNFGRWGSDWTSNSESRTFGTTDTLYVAKTGHGDWAGLFRAGRAGFDLALGPHDKASMSGRVGAWDGGSGGNSDVTERHLPVDSVRQFLLGRSWENTRRFFFLTADHEHTFDTAGQKLTLSAYAVENNGRSESRNAEINSAGTDTTSGRRTAEPGPWKRANVELGYTLPAREKDRLEAGLQSRFEGMSQDYQLSNYDPIGDSWVLDTLSSHPYGGTQTIHSLYATYSWNWRALGVQPGLRGEYGDRVVEVTDTTTRWKVSRLDYFPSVHTTWSFESGQQMKASYSRRIDRPDPWYLRPFPVWFDARTVSVGYPELKPSYANSWELGCEIPFGGNSVSAEGYWRTTSDMVEWITTKEDSIVRKYTQDTTVLLQTARNVGRDRSIGVELTANVSPVKWFTAYLTGDVSDYHEEGRLFGQDFSSGIFYWTTSANLTFRLPTNTQVQLNGDFSGPSITATGRDDGWFGTNLAVKQTLLNRALSVTLRLSNLHGSRTQRSTSRGPGFKTQSEWRSEGLTASLAVSYNLNNFRFDPKMRAGEGVEQGGGGGGGGPQR